MKTNLIFLFLVFASVIGSAQTLTLKVEGIENVKGYRRSLSGTTYRYVCHFIVSG